MSERTVEDALAHAQLVKDGECDDCEEGEHELVLYEDVPLLLDEIERLRTELERLTQLMKG